MPEQKEMRMRMRVLRSVVTIALVASVAASSSCGTATTVAGLDKALGALDGVRDVDVSTIPYDDDHEHLEIVVDLHREVTVDQAADVLATAAEAGERRRPFDLNVYLHAATTEYTSYDQTEPFSGIWFSSEDAIDIEPRTLAERLVLGVAELGDLATVRVAGDGETRAILDRGLGPTGVSEAASRIIESDDLAAMTSWSVRAGDDSLSAQGAMTSTARDAWTDLAATERLAPGGRFRGLDLRSETDGSGSVVLDVLAGIRLPGDVSRGALTPERYRGDVEPLLRAQLDVLRRNASAGSALTLSNEFVVAGSAPRFDFFVEAVLGPEKGEPDRPARGWTPPAETYLDR